MKDLVTREIKGNSLNYIKNNIYDQPLTENILNVLPIEHVGPTQSLELYKEQQTQKSARA